MKALTYVKISEFVSSSTIQNEGRTQFADKHCVVVFFFVFFKIFLRVASASVSQYYTYVQAINKLSSPLTSSGNRGGESRKHSLLQQESSPYLHIGRRHNFFFQRLSSFFLIYLFLIFFFLERTSIDSRVFGGESLTLWL